MTDRLLLARALRRLRLERGMTLRQAGKALGLVPSSVFRIENRQRQAASKHAPLAGKPLTAERLAQAFGVDIKEVLRPCSWCGYCPPLGYRCLHCGTENHE